MAAIGFELAMTAPLEVLLARRFHIGSVALALYVLASGVGALVIDVFGTGYVPRLDPRRALTSGVLIFGASSVVLAVAPNLVALVIGRAIQGFGGGMVGGAALQAAVRVHDSRERALGSTQSSLMLGGAFGAVAGGLIASMVPGTAGYRLAFVVCAAVGATIALYVRCRLPPLPTGAVAPPRFGAPRIALPPALRLALTIGMLGHYLRGGLENTALPLVGDARGFSTAVIGLALGLLALVQIVTLRSARFVFSRWDPTRVLRVGLPLGVAALVLLALSSSAGVFLCVAIAFGVVDAIAMIAPPLLILSLSDTASTGLASYRIACGVGSLLGATTVTVAVGVAGSFAGLPLVGGALLGSMTLVGALGRRAAVSSA